MSSINTIQAIPFTLAEPIGTTETEIAVKNFVDIYGNRVVMSGDIQYATIDPLSAENQEIISYTDLEETTSTITTLLGVTRGLDAQPDPVTGVYGTDPANARSHGANITCILSDNPQVWDKKTSKDEDETITGYWDFTHLPTSQGGNATDSDQLITYAQALALATGTASINRIVVSGYAGETIAIGEIVYLKASDNRWYKASASASATSENVILGVAQGAGTAGNAILNGVMIRGVDSNQIVVADTKYYLSDVAGDLSTTPGTKTVSLALALPGSTTQILFWPNFDVVLTKDQQNALASLGTPSASNLYEDQYDTSNGSTKTATTIGFVSGTKTITDSGNGLVTAGFKQGTQITITGSASNNGTFTIVSVAAGAIVVAESLVTEAAGASVVMITVMADKLARRLSNGNITLVTETTGNSTTNGASTAFVQQEIAAANIPSLNTLMNAHVGTTSYVTDRLFPTVGTTADAISNGWIESNAIMSANQGGGGIIFFDTTASADASITTLIPGKGSQAYFRFADIGANTIIVKTRIKFGTSVGATEAMSWGFNTLTELEDNIGESIRFCIADNTGDKLYAVTANGTNNRPTNVTGSLTLTDWLNLAMVITSTQVLFYAGNGSTLSLVATHTSASDYLPTGTTQMSLGWGIVDNGSQPDMYISPIYISLPTT